MSSSSFLYNGQIYEIGEDNILRSEGIPYISVNPDGTFQFAGNVGDVPSSFITALANNTQLQQNILTAFGKVQSNVATTDSNPDDQGGSTSLPETQQNPITDSFLMYPSDLAKTDQDVITFQAHTYESGGRVDTGVGWGKLNPVKYNPLDPIVVLPIQSSITDQNSVGWESDTMNPIEVQAARISFDFMKSDTSDITARSAEHFQQALEQAKKQGEGVRAYLAGQAIGVNNLQSRLLGQVLNPNLELLFQGPQLRPFNYTFKMSARDSPEATTIKKIINYFKKNMAVKNDQSIFLKAPNVFKIRYQYKNDAHPGLNLIKMCALTNCSVDYTPLGSYMTYNDGTMVAYTMTLSFQELTPIYDTDYTKGFDYGDGQDKVVNHPIGA